MQKQNTKNLDKESKKKQRTYNVICYNVFIFTNRASVNLFFIPEQATNPKSSPQIVQYLSIIWLGTCTSSFRGY